MMQPKRVTITWAALVAMALLPGAGCGGEDEQVKGPHVKLVGSQYKVFAISEQDLTVTCKIKPGMGEFSFEAASSPGKDTGTFFRYAIKQYTKPKTYDFVHSPTSLAFELKVGFDDPEAKTSADKGYRYEYWYHRRTDISKDYPSKCTINLNEAEQSTGTRYSGTVDCIMLWAASDSKDNSNGVLNAFVDLFASFTCLI